MRPAGSGRYSVTITTTAARAWQPVRLRLSGPDAAGSTIQQTLGMPLVVSGS